MKQQQTHEQITPWKDRLNFGSERSPSNKERMAAMEAEIKELRRPHRALIKALERAENKLNASRARAEHWRKIAYHYQAELARSKRAAKEASSW